MIAGDQAFADRHDLEDIGPRVAIGSEGLFAENHIRSLTYPMLCMEGLQGPERVRLKAQVMALHMHTLPHTYLSHNVYYVH